MENFKIISKSLTEHNKQILGQGDDITRINERLSNIPGTIFVDYETLIQSVDTLTEPIEYANLSEDDFFAATGFESVSDVWTFCVNNVNSKTHLNAYLIGTRIGGQWTNLRIKGENIGNNETFATYGDSFGQVHVIYWPWSSDSEMPYIFTIVFPNVLNVSNGTWRIEITCSVFRNSFESTPRITFKKCILNDTLDFKTINGESITGSTDISVQSTISDLDEIRSGAALGATALQSVPSEYATLTDVETMINNMITTALNEDY